MATYTLYAYALESDIQGRADLIESQFKAFVGARNWICLDAWPVNQANDESFDVGLNLVLPESNQEPEGWFADVEAVVAFCEQIQKQIGVAFVIGVSDGQSAEEIIEVGAEPSRVAYLKQFLGVGSLSAQQIAAGDVRNARA